MISSSVISALLAILLYRQFEHPREIIIRESIPVRYTGKEDPVEPRPSSPLIKFPMAPTHFVSAAESAVPGVVNISTKQKGRVFNFWDSNSYGTSSGSGVIISPDGYIVTNNHVVEDGDEISVTLADKREYAAKLKGMDPGTDLALLKIEEEGLPFLHFGDSDSLRIGSWVLAVGNPFNLESTVTAGIVSAKGRSINRLEGPDRIESFIQTDAAVNPGNSGGALVDMQGQLIGINTAIITRSGQYEGYSFAVPSNLVQKVIRDLRDFGTVQRGLLGVFINEMNNERAKSLGLDAVEGVYISRVSPGSGADDAGLKKGDVIIAINGVKTETLPEMQEQVGRYRPGNTISISFIRNQKQYQVEVTLKNKLNSTSLVSARNEQLLEDMGFELRNLTAEELDRLESTGVRVVNIDRGSVIDKTNMMPGFIITSLDGRPTPTVEELIEALRLTDGKTMLKGIYEEFPGEYAYQFEMDPE